MIGHKRGRAIGARVMVDSDPKGTGCFYVLVHATRGGDLYGAIPRAKRGPSLAAAESEADRRIQSMEKRYAKRHGVAS